MLEHERLLGAKQSATSEESETRSEAGDLKEEIGRALARIRKGVLSAYENPEDPRIGGYGPLGIGQDVSENVQRLKHLATFMGPKLESGELALVQDLRPPALMALVERHSSLREGKAGATTTRQVKSKTLKEAREDSRVMLQRIKNFVKSYYGAEELTAFGFDLPVPAKRPRLSGVTTDTEPLPEAPTA